mgnify:CR=1 FL=1
MKIVYISHRYPAVTGTFIYNEVMGLKEEGLNIQVYSFTKPSILNLTPEMKEAIKETIYFPFILNPKFIFAQIYFLFSKSFEYIGLFITVSFARHQQYTNVEIIFHNLI